MLAKKAVILFKAEGTYGTDSTPTLAANALVTSVPDIEILGEGKKRNIVLPSYGEAAPVNVGEGIKISFDVELKPSGAAGTAPYIGPLLEACNLSKTVSAGVHVKYTPHSDLAGASVTLYYHRDGIRHKVLGCRGTFKVKLKAGDIIVLSFEFTGLYSGTHADDEAWAAPTFTAQEALPVLRFVSAQFEIDEYAALIENLEFDLGNVIGKRSDVNASNGISAYCVMDRKVKGSCDPEAEALSTYDPWTLWHNGTAGDITFTLGQSAGSQVIFNLSNCSKDVPKYGSRETILTYQLGFQANPSLAAGNDELEIIFQ